MSYLRKRLEAAGRREPVVFEKEIPTTICITHELDTLGVRVVARAMMRDHSTVTDIQARSWAEIENSDDDVLEKAREDALAKTRVGIKQRLAEIELRARGG